MTNRLPLSEPFGHSRCADAHAGDDAVGLSDVALFAFASTTATGMILGSSSVAWVASSSIHPGRCTSKRRSMAKINYPLLRPWLALSPQP